MRKFRITKYIISVVLMCSFFCINFLGVYAEKEYNIPIAKSKYVILATITDATDSTYTLSNEYVLSCSDGTKLPSELVFSSFRYSYNAEFADNYNTPHIGDNIVIGFENNGNYYTANSDIYRISSVTYASANIMVPREIIGTDDVTYLAAVAYYIRSNGERTEYITDNKSIYAKTDDKQFLINYSNDYIQAYSEEMSGTEHREIVHGSPILFSRENLWLLGAIIIGTGMVIGLIVLYFINKKIKEN